MSFAGSLLGRSHSIGDPRLLQLARPARHLIAALGSEAPPGGGRRLQVDP